MAGRAGVNKQTNTVLGQQLNELCRPSVRPSGEKKAICRAGEGVDWISSRNSVSGRKNSTEISSFVGRITFTALPD